MPLGASGVGIDSRKVMEGQLFVAIKGENFDGHDYVDEAILKGSAGVIVEKVPQDTAGKSCAAVIEVESTLGALADMAKSWRDSLAGLKVAAVTGSNGKTTTKDMTHNILSVSRNPLSTSGNLNNHIGLPMTLLKLDRTHDSCVLEMGMNSFGEIRALAAIASPSVGTITNIGNAHLEKMKDLEGVARAKGELVENFGKEDTFCVNADDPRVLRIADGVNCRKITYGVSATDAFIGAEEIRHDGLESMEFSMRIGDRTAKARIRGIGVHNVSNALSAAAMAHSLGCGMNEILAGLEKYVPTPMRLEVVRAPAGFRVINDTYNANPDSVRAALCELVRHRTPGTKAVAVLGDMLELGEGSEREHEKIGEHISKLGLDAVVAVGKFAGALLSGARGCPERHAAESPEKAADILSGICGENDLALVKGSRGMKMEGVIHKLYEK